MWILVVAFFAMNGDPGAGGIDAFKTEKECQVIAAKMRKIDPPEGIARAEFACVNPKPVVRKPNV